MVTRRRLLPHVICATVLMYLCAEAFGAKAGEPARFIRPPDPWPGPTGAVIYVEGEDFIVNGEGWQAETLQGMRFGETAAARMRVLSGRHAGKAEPSREVAVPARGDYRLWVRYSQWPADVPAQRAPFRVVVAQDGRTVADAVFDEVLAGPPPEGRPHTTRLVWYAATSAVPLQAGAATLRLIKTGPDKVRADARRVDCVLLTADPVYAADERDFVPQTYVRFTPRAASITAGYFEIFITYMRRPWHRHISIDRRGARIGVWSKREDLLPVGQDAPWVNLSRHLYNDSPAKCLVRFTEKYQYADATNASYAIDFAPRPDPAAIVKTVQREGAGGFMEMTIPSDLGGGERPMQDIEYARARLDMVAKLPPVAFGRRPTRFPLFAARPASDDSNTPGVADLELQAMEYLGINGLRAVPTEQDARHGMLFGRWGQRMWFMGDGGYNDPQIDRLTNYIRRGAALFRDHAGRDRVRYMQLMDEACATGLNIMADRELDQRCFRQWLQNRGLTAQTLGVASNADIRLVADREAQPPALYYWSQRFRAWSVANFFLRTRRLIAEFYPKGADALAAQNFSDGAVYMANLYAQGNDYYTWFKDLQALGTAMSEDWTNGGATWQLCGWNCALLRSATRYHGQPLLMNVISSFGRRPLDVKLKALSDIAQGAKLLLFYDYTPLYRTNSSVFGHIPEILAAIAEVAREIGAAEDFLVDARPRRAETAILYSIPYDIWNVGHDNSLGHERMFTYLALRHAQVPVDVISDADVHESGLAGYKVVYAFGEPIDARAIPPLAQFVRDGGTLVLSPGALSADEYNRPTAALDQALGLERQPAAELQRFWHSSAYACKLLKAQGRVALAGSANAVAAPLLARSQTFTVPGDSAVTARFEDGRPAAARLAVGKGWMCLTGFLPAAAYMQQAYRHYAVGEDAATITELGEQDLSASKARGPAADEQVAPLTCVAQTLAAMTNDPALRDPAAIRIPRSLHSACPFDYPEPLRRFIVAPALDAGVAQPVTVDRPVVEATFMEGEQGWVVPLANYTGGPLEAITVTIRAGRPCGPVFSSRMGKLTVRHEADTLIVTLPLESTDFVFAPWRKGSDAEEK